MFQREFTSSVEWDDRFQYTLDTNRRLFSFQLKSRPDLQLMLQENDGGYYVILFDKDGDNTSFPSPREKTYDDTRKIREFLYRLVQFIDGGGFEEAKLAKQQRAQKHTRPVQVHTDNDHKNAAKKDAAWYKNYLHFKN